MTGLEASDRESPARSARAGRVTLNRRFTLVAFIVQVAVLGSAVSSSATLPDGGTVAVYWGQAPFLVLASAAVQAGWLYEATRWRITLRK